MSFYTANFCRVIVKPEFAGDMERVRETRDWGAAQGEALSALISKGLGE